jgi:hypothetical protein
MFHRRHRLQPAFWIPGQAFGNEIHELLVVSFEDLL